MFFKSDPHPKSTPEKKQYWIILSCSSESQSAFSAIEIWGCGDIAGPGFIKGIQSRKEECGKNKGNDEWKKTLIKQANK